MSTGKIIVTRVEDTTPSDFPWGQIRWLFHGRLASDAEMTFAVVTLRAGQTAPPHSHANCEELMYALKGRFEVLASEETHLVSPGALIRIPRAVHHQSRNTSPEDAVLVCAYSAPVRETRVGQPPIPNTASAGAPPTETAP
ncbi:MAG TPA: cupin domain-containing protein [Candidatus Brocadiia bacterium]|nr:cupin domain-containing protein [Candidatus Brocadiia bacterium]